MAPSIAAKDIIITTAPTFHVTFPVPMDSVNYSVKHTIYPTTITADVDPDSLTTLGFDLVNVSEVGGSLWYLTRENP